MTRKSERAEDISDNVLDHVIGGGAMVPRLFSSNGEAFTGETAFVKATSDLVMKGSKINQN